MDKVSKVLENTFAACNLYLGNPKSTQSISLNIRDHNKIHQYNVDVIHRIYEAPYTYYYVVYDSNEYVFVLNENFDGIFIDLDDYKVYKIQNLETKTEESCAPDFMYEICKITEEIVARKSRVSDLLTKFEMEK